MILGIDVSKWQGVMDWAKAASAGALFAFMRAGGCGTDGMNFKDDQWDNNIANAPNWMPCGSYWYFQPAFNATLQADFFTSIIKNQPLYLPPIIDVETNGGQTALAVKTAVKQFVYRVYYNIGQRCGIYTRSSFWNPSVADSELWEILDLWIARYMIADAPWTGTTLKPRDWSTWQFWQWSADNNGRGAEFGAQSLSIDIDYFNGTIEELHKRYRIPDGGMSNPSIASAFIRSYGQDEDGWYVNIGLGLA